ncbi:MAG: YggT family protein [Deltaproteobacteria bacterium]|nr:YggT family protein [Deltaproteobacteria bacterium]MBV8451807.1 YggT family protein [Deltaproteobacteria bacterium]
MLYQPLPIVIAQIIEGLLSLYFWIVIISAVLSWIEPNPYNPIVRVIYSLTEPVFDFVREHLPVIFSGIDLSPLVVIIVIQILSQWAVPRLADLLVSV